MITALTIYLAGVLIAFCLNMWLGTAPDGSPSGAGESLKIGLVWPAILIVALIARFSSDDE